MPKGGKEIAIKEVITISHYSRDIDELRMDAQDMMEEMENIETMMNEFEFDLCIHGVSKYHLCKFCEREWEKHTHREKEVRK